MTASPESLRDHRWMAAQLGRTPRWVLDHLDEIPHRRVGKFVMFHPDDYAAYVRSVERQPSLMQTTGRRRTA